MLLFCSFTETAVVLSKMSDDSEEEELDYHVTFPPATGLADQDGVPQRREPVVLLFGWVGCTDKNLSKYSAIYQSKGYTTIRYTAPKSRVFTHPDSLADISRKLLELLFDLGLDENPIFFHAFSNGGAFIYRHCLEMMVKGENSDFRNLKLAGSVLDSAPCDPSPWTAMKAMFHSRNNTPLLAVIFLMCMFAVMAILDLILPSKFRRASSLSTFLESIAESPSKRPQLFLYSKKISFATTNYWKR